MDRRVEITVEGIITPLEGGPEESYRTVSEGEYFFRQGSHYLRYLERLEGADSPVPCLIKLGPEGFSLRRSGEVRTHMRFEEGLLWQDAYISMAGSLPMTIETHEVWVEVGEEAIECRASYTLSLSQTPLSRCRIRIRAVKK